MSLLYDCASCSKRQIELIDGHFCRPLKQFICHSCYKYTRHEMYCGDNIDYLKQPEPLKVVTRKESQLANRCHKNSHYYQHIQDSGRVLLYCRHCGDIKRIDMNADQQTNT